MAFWGIEVKPGKPFTLSHLSARLRLSQATLGMGNSSSTKKSVVQCNVGSKRPVYVCCLLPDKTESCYINLEFEETEDVVFSVIGPQSVHLTGYYVSSLSCKRDDESESYGEDVGESDTERSENSEESEYDGSFIDDDPQPQNLPSSPDSSAKSIEEKFDLKKSKNGKVTRRKLRKKYQVSESENDEASTQKIINNVVAAVDGLESEFEDSLPISALSRGKHASNSGKVNVEEKAGKELDEVKNNETEDIVTMSEGTNAAKPESESGVRNEEPQKLVLRVHDGMPKKSEVLLKEERISEAALCMTGKAELEQNQQIQNMGYNEEAGVWSEETQNLVMDVDYGMSKTKREDNGMTEKAVFEQNEQNQKLGCDEEGNFELHPLPASTQVTCEDGVKLKRKRKKHVEVKTHEDNVAKEDEDQKNESNLDAATLDVHVEDKETQNQVNEKPLPASTQVTCEDGTKLKRKRKKRIEKKTQEDNVAKEDEGEKNSSNLDAATLDVDKETPNQVNEKHLPASTQVNFEDGTKLKRKRKKHIEEKTQEDNVAKEDEGQKNGSNLDAASLDVHLEDKETQNQVNEKETKRKKRLKNKDSGDAMKMEAPLLTDIENDRSVMEMDGKNANEKAIQLANGMIIEELDMGKPNGKQASLGKKVCVHYTGKLKESGQVFYSSAGKALSKFQLGGEEVPEVWNVGIDGMRVGGKRRLTVPPSVSCRNEGAGENILPDSWLVFDVELVKVR